MGIPAAGLALIHEMFRTATNVTGDTMDALMVDASEERAATRN